MVNKNDAQTMQFAQFRKSASLLFYFSRAKNILAKKLGYNVRCILESVKNSGKVTTYDMNNKKRSEFTNKSWKKYNIYFQKFLSW